MFIGLNEGKPLSSMNMSSYDSNNDFKVRLISTSGERIETLNVPHCQPFQLALNYTH